MNTWLALLAAPALALACQAVLFALATPSCSMQDTVAMHAVAAVSLVLTLVFAALARHRWLLLAGPPAEGFDADHGDATEVRAFLAAAGVAVALLSALTIVAMWIAVWVLSPCWQ
jgi:hypothetical protein